MVEHVVVYFAGRYYLVDSGYALCEGYLGPYRSTRYHLEEFRRRGAETREEKFNYHHASLRNVVERAFGVLKAKWHILEAVPFYARKKQTKMIIACCALQNFLLDRHLARQPEPFTPVTVDAAMSLWVAANASSDMATVRDWISIGISFIFTPLREWRFESNNNDQMRWWKSYVIFSRLPILLSITKS
ncbi:hypothetical protein U9M48_033577 [Paspalum notatum var. saurae]|uniref:DDE Tnp4 domain-containing protein n=1 Tax=Paspalum notatum var. saurae TaxID=547442 RepID=A0AAQ3X6C8_PASNO